MGSVAAASRLVELQSQRRPAMTEATGRAESGSPGRALVPVARTDRSASGPTDRCNTSWRPSATFLAHLIAAKRNLPQARERRRAEPHEAIAAYAAAARRG